MSKTNHIYAIALSSASGPSATWAILVQPKKTTKWFMSSNQTPASTAFGSGGKINDITPSAIHLQIQLGENHMPSITQHVADVLAPPFSSTDPTTWLRDATSALQHANLIDAFDVAAFTSLAAQTLQLRQERAGPKTAAAAAEIDHQGRPISRAGAKAQKKGRGFWVSYGPHVSGYGPRIRESSRRNSWERQDEAYGGLM